VFIDFGSFVTVKADGSRPDLAGRFGVVERIRIASPENDVLVFVALFEPGTGASPLYVFEPRDLEKRRPVATTASRTRDHVTDHMTAMELMAA